MGELIPDPELERIIHEMNREERAEHAEPEAAAAWDGPDLREVHGDEPLEAILGEMVLRQASDLLLVPDSQPVVRINGRLESLPLAEVTDEEIRGHFTPHLSRRAQRLLAERGSIDFSLHLAGSSERESWRLRVNLQRQGGRLAAAIRALPRRIPSLEELALPPVLGDLGTNANGLVLVCGPTGSGKSTTLAAILDRLNHNEFRHIITIEDPVEYEHRNKRSVFEQVEVGSDAPGFALALRASLRRDPDVILVGEMRDLETISTALTAAETGHLVLSTLHTADSAQAIHRIIDVFEGSRQEQIRHQLALSLRAIVSQQLIPTATGRGRVPAIELLLANYAVRNHIRRGNIERLYNEIMAGRSLGMQTMEQALTELVRNGAISAEDALARSSRPDELNRMLSSSS
jgi:twitching motility protein PilT